MPDWSDRTIPYGRNTAGHMVSALYVDRGLACGCVCPQCGVRLIAHHQGPNDGTRRRQASHFQHVPDADGAAAVCATAHETSIHEKAKTIIAANTSLMTPVLMVGYHDYARVGVASGWLAYTSSGLEVTLADVGRRPDAMIETADGPVAIEIFVTSRSKLEKRADFSAHGLAAIEIDLSSYDRAIVDDEIALTEAVLNAARREWLFHPQKAALAGAFAAECIEAERVAAVAQASRLTAIAEADHERVAVQVEAQRRKMEAADKAAAEGSIDARLRLDRLTADYAKQQRLQEVLAIERADHQRHRQIMVAAAALAAHDADGTSQRCTVCDKPNSPFGFGLPPQVTTWACLDHRAEVDAGFVPGLYTPLKRTRSNPRGRPGDKAKQGQLF